MACTPTTTLTITESESESNDNVLSKVKNKIKRHQTNRSVEFKLNAIKRYNQNGCNARKTAAEMKIGLTTLRGWIKNEIKLSNFAKNCKTKIARKSIRETKRISFNDNSERQEKAFYPDMEKSIFDWFKAEREKKNPVNSERIQEKARAIYRELYKNNNFTASNGWLNRFILRFNISNRIKTGNGQKIKSDAGIQALSFLKFVATLIEENTITINNIGGMDEVPMYFDMIGNHSYDHRGAKHVLVNSTGYDHFRFTVVLAFLADGRKLSPMIIFKNRKYPPKITIKTDCIIRASKSGSMDAVMMRDWINSVWLKRPGMTSHLFKSNKSLLVFDSARGHIVNDIKTYLKDNCGTKIAVIPGGCTPLLQPGDVAIHRSFKSKVRSLYLEWLCKEKINLSELTKSKKRKRAAYVQIVDWIQQAWDAINVYNLQNSFKICGITSNDYDNYNHLLKQVISKNQNQELYSNEIGNFFAEDECLGEDNPTNLTDDSDNESISE